MPDEFLKKTEDAITGIPNEMHITVKYGLLTEDINEVMGALAGTQPFTVTLGRASVFHNDKESVVKLGVESRELREFHNKVCKGLKNVNLHPEFRPHVTVAYVIKREDDPYYYRAFFSDEFQGRTFEVGQVIFSSAGGQKSLISFDGEVVPMQEERMEKIAGRMVADYRDATLEDLKGGVEFIPKFHNGRSFIVTLDGVYRRGPYGSENFVLCTTVRHMILELGLSQDEEAAKPFLYYGGNMKKLVDDLKATGMYHTKVIT